MKASLLFLTIFVTSGVKTANILLFTGVMCPSVCYEMGAFGEELIKRGHKVSLYLPTRYDYSFMSKSPIKILNFKMSQDDKNKLVGVLENLSNKVFTTESDNMFKLRSSILTMMNTICDSVFADKESLKQLKEEKFDLIVVEALFFTKCLYYLPRYLNVSYVGQGSSVDERVGGLPFQALSTPHVLSKYSNTMSFLQRLQNVAVYIFQYLIGPYFIYTTDPATYDPSLAGISAEDLMQDALLYLENSDYVVDYPKALMPNFVQVGGLTATPAKKLPLELDSFMSGADDGVVVVSFGSILKQAPKEIMDKLMAAFVQLKQRVLFKTDSDFVKDNVMSVKWMPQNDVLGHPKVKVFMSHCGKNGFFESVYHGVPVICTPLNVDAFSTASKVVYKQIGLSLNLKTASANDIVNTINTILTNSSYEDNMRRTSQLLRDRPETPQERAASAIEHVIKYGGDHMKSSVRHLSLMSYVYADLWLIIFSIVIGMLFLFFTCIKFICCRKRSVIVNKTKSE